MVKMATKAFLSMRPELPRKLNHALTPRNAAKGWWLLCRSQEIMVQWLFGFK